MCVGGGGGGGGGGVDLNIVHEMGVIKADDSVCFC